jgi:Na+-translocating ferredoxin:NAD+ oxidoreductase RnfD subunit
LLPVRDQQAAIPAVHGRFGEKRGLFLPLTFALGLAGLALLNQVRQNPKTLWSFVSAAAALCAWDAILWAARQRRTLKLEVVLKKQHYLQACAQGSVLLYWGWHWPSVYAFAPFILAQLLFAYSFDMLLSWSRREVYTVGFAPFPVIFSMNLFLWFKPDWFYLQFAMVAVGFAAKELIRWNKDGRRAHIFNPSSFPLALASLVLLVTRASSITWGQEIASTQFYPPHMYLALFLIGLPGQFFFGVTSMTMSAVLAAYVFGRLYFAATGIYFFYDSYIPIAVFLGMHLLFTDPSTSPRTELGRIVYGALYGLSTVALYELLGRAGMPTFYDKLLQVPLLNLTVKAIDRAARSPMFRGLDPAALGRALLPRQRNLAYMSVWAAVFAVMSATQAVGNDHPGQWLPFWRHACQDGRAYACPYLADLETKFCEQGSGWACNEAGLLHVALSRSGEDLRRLDPAGAAKPLRRGCELGFTAACGNLGVLNGGAGSFAAAPPTIEDYPVILRGSNGEVRDNGRSALYALACREGWTGACGIAEAAVGQ